MQTQAPSLCVPLQAPSECICTRRRFSIYFCLIHSVRHFTSMKAMLSDTISKLQITKTTVLFSAICWAVGLIILAQQSTNIGIEPALLQVIFIGLAALTVPHMMLVDGYTEYQKSRPILT